ncbi:MAG: transposase [Fimbriimonadales bacterium]
MLDRDEHAGQSHTEVMYLEAVFARFAQKSPVTVMTRALMENALAPGDLDELFAKHAVTQYERTLLFSSVVNLMGLVVCKVQPAVSAAYRAVKDTLPVSMTALYDKINGVEPEVSAALVRHTGERLGAVVEAMGGEHPALLPGYRVKIIDGNHFAATERRLAVLRQCKAGPLPGHALVILDPALMLATDMIPCEDGHAQERSLFAQVLASVCPGEFWIGDRNFCTVGFLQGIVEHKSFFGIRQHANFPIATQGTLHSRGRCATGEVFEQSVTFVGDDDRPVKIRRILVRLDKPTRDGDTEIGILTNVPAGDASAPKIAELYQERWTLEGLFQMLTQTLNGEIPSLGYPKAALFAFSVALVSYNIASVVRAALRTKFGHEKVEQETSNYYIANEIRATYKGMDLALDEIIWEPFQAMLPKEMARKLLEYSANVRLSAFKRTPRGPKKPVPPRTKHTTETHVSTARLLAEAGVKR